MRLKIEDVEIDATGFEDILEPSASVEEAWSKVKVLRTLGVKMNYFLRPPADLDELRRRIDGTGIRIVDLDDPGVETGA